MNKNATFLEQTIQGSKFVLAKRDEKSPEASLEVAEA
jgi:hypothetical protein